VTNSAKHAFKDRAGTVKIELAAGLARGEMILTVSDNGQGIKNPKGSGSGTRLLEALALQLRGMVTVTSDTRGTTTLLRFAAT